MLPSNVGLTAPTIAHNKHWQELLRRAYRLSSVYVILNALLWWQYDQIWAIFLGPIERLAAAQVVILSLSSPFFLTVQLILWAAFCLWFPYALFEVGAFIRPGLYGRERWLSSLLAICFLLLFFWGQWFAWSCVVPWSISFFVQFNGAIAQPMLEFDRLVGYVLGLQQAFFLLAAWPMLLLLVVAQGVIQPSQLRSARGIVYVLSFVLGMLLTPPDCVAQCCVALPLLLLYEIVVIFSTFFAPKEKKEND